MFDINWHIHVLGTMLFDGHNKYKTGHKLNRRKVTNYEIEYIIKGGGGMYINDVFYEVKEGDVIFRKPGDTTRGVMPYTCYFIVFGTTRETYLNREKYTRCENNLPEKAIVNQVLERFVPVWHSVLANQFDNDFRRIHESYTVEENIGDYRRRLLLEGLLIKLYDVIHNNQTSELIHPYAGKIHKVKTFMEENLYKKIYLEELAEIAGLSLFHFNRVFKEQEGYTPIEYLTKLKMDVSKTLLLTTNEPITDIAYMCGFESSSYYSYVFKKNEGKSPREFRKVFMYEMK